MSSFVIVVATIVLEAQEAFYDISSGCGRIRETPAAAGRGLAEPDPLQTDSDILSSHQQRA